MQRLVLLMIVVLSGGFSVRTWGQSCILGEAPSDFCTAPRVIPGNEGQHVVLMDVHNATGPGEVQCNFIVGRTVWFSVTPAISGPVTISTCHPATSFDTVLEVFSGGDGACASMTPVACNDDTADPLCTNGCSGAGSTVTFDAWAGVHYRFAVGSYNDNSGGCPLCLGVIVTIGQPCGDPPRGLACGVATELPGTPGTHQVEVDVADAAAIPGQPQPGCVAEPVGHPQWFKTTPQVSGPMVFTTCHPTTTYDTVVAAYAGDCTGLLVNLACSDDELRAQCGLPCNTFGRSSQVVVYGTEGQTYYFQVGSYNNNGAQCELCLGAALTILDCNAMGPPTAQISAPTDLQCACDVILVMGSAFAPGESFGSYRLDYRPLGGGSWTAIRTSREPLVSDVLAVWDTTGLGEGWYALRLTVSSLCGADATDIRIVRLDKSFDSLEIREPDPLEVVGRGVCPDGTAWDQCFDHYVVGYRPIGGVFQHVDLMNPTYQDSVINDPLAAWNSSLVPDGAYELQVMGTTVCGRQDQANVQVIVDNTAPTAVITSPTECQCIAGGLRPIFGTAADSHLAHWTLQYTGGPHHGWVDINHGSLSAFNTVLGYWDTSGLPPCDYTLRLIATDDAVLDCNGAIHHQTEYLVSVSLGPCYDFDVDDDGDIDLIDYREFETEFTGP